MQEVYWSTPKPLSGFEGSSKVNVVVHVRAGDTSESEQVSTRAFAGSAVTALRARLAGQASFWVHTDGDPIELSDFFGQAGDLRVFGSNSATLRCVFHHMISADILVAPGSSMTNAAALIGNMTVLSCSNGRARSSDSTRALGWVHFDSCLEPLSLPTSLDVATVVARRSMARPPHALWDSESCHLEASGSSITTERTYQDLSDLDIHRILKNHAVNGTVTLTGSDSSPEFEGLIANWACNMHRAGIKPLIWAFDLSTHQKLTQQRIGSIPVMSIYSERLLLMQSAGVQEKWNSSKSEFKLSGGEAYFAAVAFKPLVMMEVLRLGFDALWIDVDIGIVQNPLPFLLSRPHLDLQVSMNYPYPKINSGLVHARSRRGVRRLFATWVDLMTTHDCVGWECGDQELLNKLLEDRCGWQSPSRQVTLPPRVLAKQQS